LKNYRADIYDACVKAIDSTHQDLDFIRIDKAAIETCTDELVDYPIMELLAANGEVVVTSLDAGWNDMGSWSALWNISNKNKQGNVTAGQDDDNFILQDSNNFYVYSTNVNYGSSRMIATLCVDNLVIIVKPDALLVANKEKVKNIKLIVEKIKESCLSLHH
jgi:mannose-1-phosphate guanylyltransferase